MGPANLTQKARQLKKVRELLGKIPNARVFHPDKLAELLREECKLTLELEGFDLGPRPIQLQWDASGLIGHAVWQFGDRAYATTATLSEEAPSRWCVELSRPDAVAGVFTLRKFPSRLCFQMFAETREGAKEKANYGLWVLWARTVRGERWSRGKGIFAEEPK